MVRDQIVARGIQDERVLAAMGRVARHRFVPEAFRGQAYDDGPLPIGFGQTLSQPYIVAFMTTTLELHPRDRVLEVGTGSGYQAAVLAELGCAVYSIERLGPLARQAAERLAAEGFSTVKVRAGDGYEGWPEAAPFDAILVACAPEQIPPALVAQLKRGGRMLVPVGPTGGVQELILLRKTTRGLERWAVLPVRFVPMVKGRDPSEPRSN
jgi:protein-L-isoaspartate(D-aspartate) O-methyltransferase